jgi:hypothetical protein
MASEPGVSYDVVLNGAVETLDRNAMRDRIRRGEVDGATSIAVAGSESWMPAAEYPELQRYLALASHTVPQPAPVADDDYETVSAGRLIAYLTLAGFTAALMMSILAPVCMIFGGFAHDLLITGAFGAVLGLGINSALKQSNSRMINICAAGFAVGGLVATILPVPLGEFGFSGVHLAVIGLCGGIGLAWALRLPPVRAIPVVAAATILFPLSLMAHPARHGMGLNIHVPLLLTPVLLLVVMSVPCIPFAIFGTVLGLTLAYGPGARRVSA